MGGSAVANFGPMAAGAVTARIANANRQPEQEAPFTGPTPTGTAADQIPTDVGRYPVPAKQVPTSPLGIGPDNEFTRNAANILNATTGGRPLSAALRAGGNAARVAANAERGVQFARGMQLGGVTAPDRAPAGPTPVDNGTYQDRIREKNVRDLTDELSTVPKDLPADMRGGVVYRTKGANGETVFSGRNVKEGADYVSGMGDRTGTLGERGNLTVVPKEAFTMTSPGMDERIGSALRAAADRGDFAAIRNYYAQQDRQAAAAAGGEAGAPQMPDTTGMTRTRAERTLRNWENQMTAYNSRMDRAATREANAAKTAFDIAKFNVEQGNKQFENKIKANQELRAQFGDIKKSLMPLFQSPELKDGKPTGKSVDDDAAFGKFQSEVVAKLGPQAAASLTASEWSSLASQYKTNAAAIERFGQGQTVVDPSLRQLGARESRLTDVLSPRFGITDYLAGAFSGSKSPRNYVVTDPNTGTIAYAPDVFGGTGDRPLNVREVQAVSPELAAKIGLRNP